MAHWRTQHLPRRRIIGPDGWCIVGIVTLAVMMTIAGFKVADLFGAQPVLKSFNITSHKGF